MMGKRGGNERARTRLELLRGAIRNDTGPVSEKKRKTRAHAKKNPSEGSTRRALLMAAPAMVVGGIAGDAVTNQIEEWQHDFETRIEGSETFMSSVEDYAEVCETESVKRITFLNNRGEFLIHPVYFPHDGDPSEEWIEGHRRRAAEIARQPYIPGESPQKETLSILDVAEHYGDTRRSELGGKTPIEYVREHAEDGMHEISPIVRRELTRLLPGIAAQESQYNYRAESHRGAQGVFQFMPGTWRDYRMHNPDTHTIQLGEIDATRPYESLPEQTRAAGWYLSKIESRLTNRLGIKLTELRDALYSGTENQRKEKFDRYFLTPCIINAYNAGEGRMAKVIEWMHREVTNGRQRPKKDSGYDAYHLLSRAAKESSHSLTSGYGPETARYFSSVFAFARTLERSVES